MDSREKVLKVYLRIEQILFVSYRSLFLGGETLSECCFRLIKDKLWTQKWGFI